MNASIGVKVPAGHSKDCQEVCTETPGEFFKYGSAILVSPIAFNMSYNRLWGLLLDQLRLSSQVQGGGSVQARIERFFSHSLLI